MKLYIMRHGPAEDCAPSGLDSDRALSREGRERTRAVARALLEQGEVPFAIVSSPLVRSVQTAEIIASVLNDGSVIGPGRGGADAGGLVGIRREMAPGGDALGLVLDLARTGHERVMVVGHEPDVSNLFSRLLGVYPEQGMQTAMVAGVAIDPGPSGAESPRQATFARKLLFVLDPKTLTWRR